MSSVWPGVRVRGTRFAGHYPWEKCPKIKSLFRYSGGRPLISRYMTIPGPTEGKSALGLSLGKIIRARRITSSAVKRAKRGIGDRAVRRDTERCYSFCFEGSTDRQVNDSRVPNERSYGHVSLGLRTLIAWIPRFVRFRESDMPQRSSRSFQRFTVDD